MNVKFYLKDAKAIKSTAIYAQVTWQRQRLRFYIDQSINPSEWNANTGRPRKGANDIGRILDNKAAAIRSVFNEYTAAKGKAPTPGTLKSLLSETFNGSHGGHQGRQKGV